MKSRYKITILILLGVIFVLIGSNHYCLSDSFKFIINTIGIPQYNAYGVEINEDIYYAYNVFAYGSPEYLEGRNLEQRWKNSGYGLWSRYVGKYNGYGTRGEYNLLGQDYSGAVINNYYFPVDRVPPTPPNTWEYYYVPGGLESWTNTRKYKYIEQLEFMKNTQMLFNDISNRDACDNPAKIKQYNITANSVGLNNSRLDASSTWKTNGIIYTRRRSEGRIYYAVFLTAPMAANADIHSDINVKDSSYIMEEDDDEISIEIGYGSNIINMTGYAKKEHIREIKSELYINGKKVSEISGSKITNVGNKHMLVITRDISSPEAQHKVSIKVDSYAHTEFALDGLMRNVQEKEISIDIKERKINPIKSTKIMLLERTNSNLVVSPLAQSNITIGKSEGITEAGRYLAIKLDLSKDNRGENIGKFDVSIDGQKVKEEEIIYAEKNVMLQIRMPKNLAPTIYGWKSMRELYGNYFKISKEDIGSRIALPHEIIIKYEYEGKEHDTKILIDTIDDYISNMNYSLNVSENSGSYNSNKQLLEDWLKE